MNINPMKNHLQLTRLVFTLVATSGLMAWVGCRTTPHRPPLTSELSRQDVTTAQINYELFDFVTQFSRRVERAADQIARDNPDSTVRRNALLWKLYAIPASYLATEHSDPLAMLVDLWALCIQQRAYFESGPGKDLFGPRQAVAIQACQELERKASDMATRFVKPEALTPARQDIIQWAGDHPLEDQLFTRPSIVTMVAEVFPDRAQGIFQTLDTVQAELADLKGRLALHMDHLPRQARWQAELLSDQVATQVVGESVTNAFALFTREREAILAAVNVQRIETLEAIRAERVAAMQSVSDQRVATLEETRKIMKEMLEEAGRMADTQREAILQAVETQRQEIFTELRADPIPLRHDVDSLVQATMDRAFSRLLLVLGISYVVLLGTAVCWYAIVRKHRRLDGVRPT